MLSGEMKNLKTYSSTKCSKQGLTDKLDLSPFVPSGLKVLHCVVIWSNSLYALGVFGVNCLSWRVHIDRWCQKCITFGQLHVWYSAMFVHSGLKVLHCQLIFDYELIGIGHSGVIRSSWKWCFSTCDYLMKKK